MRILLVNAYSSSDIGRRKYAEFREYLLKVVTEQDENLEGRNYNLIERNKDNLDEYLFDLNTSYAKREAANNFDILDLICVVGDVNLLPWQKAAEKVVILIKMCLRVKKWLFAVGFGMHALIYLSASNLERPIRVINGNGRGGKLGDLTEINVASINLNPSDYFLDHVTGDLYAFNPESEEWTPFTNVGLHYCRAAHEYNTIGKYVVKAPVYHPKAFNSPNQFNLTETSETLCILKKHEYGHWLLEDVSPEFVVYWKTRWEVHSFGFTDPSKIFSILAESKVGPMVIEYSHIIATQFDIQKRYPDTQRILKNFLHAKVRKLVSDEPCQKISVARYKELENKDHAYHGYVFKKNGTLIEVKATHGGFPNTRGVKNIDDTSQQDPKRPTTQSFNSTNRLISGLGNVPQKVFAHSGYASKNKGPQIVSQNIIAVTRIQGSKKVQKESSFSTRLQEFQEKFKENIINYKNNESEDFAELVNEPRTDINKQKNMFSKQLSLASTLQEGGRVALAQALSSSNVLQPATSKDSQNLPIISKSEARRLIYPQIREEYVGQKKAWVPGNLSKNRQEQETQKPVIRITDGLYSTGIYFKKNKTLKNLQSKDDFGFQSIHHDSPYISAEEARRKDKKEKDKKILHGKFFHTSAKFNVSNSLKSLPEKRAIASSTNSLS